MACMLACLQLQHEQRSWDRQVTEVGRISCCEVQSSRYFCMAKASTSEPPKNQSLLTPSTKRYRWRSPFWGELGGVAASPIRIPRSCPSRLIEGTWWTGSRCLSSAATTLFPHTSPFFDFVFKYVLSNSTWPCLIYNTDVDPLPRVRIRIRAKSSPCLTPHKST